MSKIYLICSTAHAIFCGVSICQHCVSYGVLHMLHYMGLVYAMSAKYLKWSTEHITLYGIGVYCFSTVSHMEYHIFYLIWNWHMLCQQNILNGVLHM